MSETGKSRNQSDAQRLQTVAIFWDIESCPVPAGVRVDTIAVNICMALQAQISMKGPVKIFSAYGNFNKFRRTMKEECRNSGVHLIDVPSLKKAAADKAILLDMFLFAIQNPPPSIILLISADVDFAPALHKLGLRGYTMVLAIPSTVRLASALLSACQFVFTWDDLAKGDESLLGKRPPEFLQASIRCLDALNHDKPKDQEISHFVNHHASGTTEKEKDAAKRPDFISSNESLDCFKKTDVFPENQFDFARHKNIDVTNNNQQGDLDFCYVRSNTSEFTGAGICNHDRDLARDDPTKVDHFRSGSKCKYRPELKLKCQSGYISKPNLKRGKCSRAQQVTKAKDVVRTPAFCHADQSAKKPSSVAEIFNDFGFPPLTSQADHVRSAQIASETNRHTSSIAVPNTYSIATDHLRSSQIDMISKCNPSMKGDGITVDTQSKHVETDYVCARELDVESVHPLPASNIAKSPVASNSQGFHPNPPGEGKHRVVSSKKMSLSEVVQLGLNSSSPGIKLRKSYQPPLLGKPVTNVSSTPFVPQMQHPPLYPVHPPLCPVHSWQSIQPNNLSGQSIQPFSPPMFELQNFRGHRINEFYHDGGIHPGIRDGPSFFSPFDAIGRPPQRF